MAYEIYFDESNKLDQPNGDYSYYGALGSTLLIADEISKEIKLLNERIHSKSELHFVDYTSDNDFEKYFKAMNYVMKQDIKVNLMIVNKKDAREIAKKMEVTLPELRELFYVKIPERLFYGMTRNLTEGQRVQIIIDQNSEYEKIELEKKLSEQMNAHSAYRSKGYKVHQVRQATSDGNVLLQLIDVFMGMVIYLLESQYSKETVGNDSTTLKVKSDLIYRLLMHNENLSHFHNRITLYKWEGNHDQITKVSMSDFTGAFLIHKTGYDILEMNKLAKLRIENPSKETKFYRMEMNYGNRQLRMVQAYLDELDGKGRNGYYFSGNK